MIEPTVTWYRVTDKFEVVQYDTPDILLAPETKYWLKQFFSGRTNTTSWDITYEMYEYEIHSSFLEPCVIDEGYLGCDRIQDTYAGARLGKTTEFRFYDKMNSVKLIEKNSNYRLDNIREAMIFLKEYRQYKTWEAIELSVENKKLKEELINLKSQIKEQNEE